MSTRIQDWNSYGLACEREINFVPLTVDIFGAWHSVAIKHLKNWAPLQPEQHAKTTQIQFNTDGSLTLTFFGIKNDTCRDGFKVSIPKSTEPKLDPSTTLRAYINRTKSPENLPSDPVFVSLNRPFKAISSTTVSLILNESIKLAGLDCAKFTAKSFRPSAATKAVESGMDPDKARRIGRWKTPSVFFDHYVFDKTPDNYTDNILDSS